MAADESFSDFFYDAPDGLKLHAMVYDSGADGRWPVVCLPGLTRNARDFHELAVHLARRHGRRVVAFDYRGRGQSAYAADIGTYNVGVEANDIVRGLDVLNVGGAAFIGTSRGGLIVHVLAAMRPSILKAIVFNDIGPAIEAEGLAHIRDYLRNSPPVATIKEAAAAQRAAHGRDFPALDARDWERMARALYRERDGRLMPDFDPKLAQPLQDMDLSQPLPTLWPQFELLRDIPVMTIRGETSRLLSAATVEKMQRLHPGMKSVTVKGQGHAPFLETGSLPHDIARFLDDAEREATLTG